MTEETVMTVNAVSSEETDITEQVTKEESIPTENNKEKVENGDNAEDETELETSIIQQVEYYFGDLNLPRDKFLREQVKLDDGWVPLEILIRFNRLAKLSTNLDVIATALNKSTSGLVEVSEDNKKVRRNPEMPLPEMNEERRKELLGRTVYAKGFPKDSVLDDILKFFKQHNEVETVIMRRYIDKSTKKRIFKGSVFATFKAKEHAEKFVGNTGLKYGETELIIRWQEDYLKDKQEEYVARKEKREKKPKNTSEKKEEKEEFKLPFGTVLHFSQGHDKMTREDVKDALTPLGAEVAYIDFKVGETEGWVRLTKENMAKEVFEKISDGKIKIGDADVVFKLLEGDEEKTYLDNTIDVMVKRRKGQKNNRNKGGKNFKGKQHGRKRKQDQNDEDEPPSKVKAEESKS